MKISDIITAKILSMLDESEINTAEIQRNELASVLGCVPSQINYVLSSRFTPEHGFVIESRRGGGGYIKITRVSMDRSSALMHIINSIGITLDPSSARIIIENSLQSKLITKQSADLMQAAVSNTVLRQIPPEYREYYRAAVIKQMLLAQI